MSKVVLPETQRAALYAAWKALETMAKDSDGPCELPPNTHKQVGGHTVTIKLPDDWAVTRSGGEDGDGNVYKTATQNLYGWSVILSMLDRAQRFNQGHIVLDLLVNAAQDALNNQTTTEEAMRAAHPELMAKLDARLEAVKAKVPKRREPTPRKVEKPDSRRKPTITVT